MAPTPESLERGRRLAAGFAGGLLALAAYFYSGLAYLLVVHPRDGAVTVTRNCVGGYHCPGKTEAAVRDVVFAVAPVAALVVTIAGAAALLRYAFGGRRPGRWAKLAAAGGPVLGFALVVALLVYGGWVGGFS
jgi:hypothetical protein